MRLATAAVIASAALVLALGLPRADAWTSRWDLSRRFAAAGHAELECVGEKLEASCCLCRSIVHQIEVELNSTKEDYELDVVYRISEEKRKVKFARSESRILEVLDDVCEHLPLRLPATDATLAKKAAGKRSKNLVGDACAAFVGEYEDELTHVFFDDFSPARDRMCVSALNVCAAVDPTREEL